MDESLNETLQEEASRERSLSLYEGTRGDDLVSEEVDERILKLLGLDDIFDIDYSTYMSLLRGKMAEARMVDKKLSTDETMLITDEFKRVKGKVGRFKLKKKKITAENLGVTGSIRVSKQQYFLTSKAIVPETSGAGEDNGDLLKNIITINDTFSKILESVRTQNKLIKKSEETDRKKKEEDQRRKREEGLEKGLSKIASVASKMLAPVQGILDKILNFILYTLLGRAFVKFIDWFNDPKNKEKVEVLKRFLKDWWPTLLGALVLFATPFGKFVRGFVGTVTKLTLKLARFAIPKLLSFAKGNPKAAALLAAGTAAVGAGVYMQSQREQRDKQLQGSDSNYGKKPGSMKSILDFGSMGGMQFNGGGMVPLRAFDNGGYVDENTGVTVTGAGADTQATVLQPGEVVFSKNSVDYWGADRLLAMNKMGGGTNIPKFVNNVQMAQGGGMIGRGNPFMGTLQAGQNFLTGAWNKLTKPKKMGPELTPGMLQNAYRRQPGELVEAAKSMIADKWSYASRGGDARNGCAPAIVELYKRTGYSLPWANIKNPNYVPDVYNYLNKNFAKVPESKRSAGDIVVWKDTGEPPGSGKDPYGHIGIVMSDGRIANNSTSRGTFTNLNSPSEARSWWPNTRELLYFRHPKINQQVLKTSSKKSQNTASSSSNNASLIAQLSSSKSNISPPGPPISNSKASFIELPPIVQQSGQQVATAGGTKVPQFMSPDTVQASINASIYGLG